MELVIFVLLFCNCAAQLSGEEVIVVPRPCSENPTHNDLDSALSGARSDVAYLLQPGEHCVSQYHLVQHLHNLTFQGNSSGKVTLNCTSGSGLGFWNVSQLRLAQLTIRHCGVWRDNISSFLDMAREDIRNFFQISSTPDQYIGVMLAACNDFVMESSMVSDTPGLGLLAINVGGNSTLYNVSFQRNVPAGCFALAFNYTTERVGGGATFYYHDYRNISDSNHPSNNNLSIVDCEFHGNSYCSYALVYTTYFPYTRSQGLELGNLTLGAGGGLSIVLTQLRYEVSVAVSGTNFTNNTAFYGGGAQVQQFTGVSKSLVSFDECNFEFNGVERSLASNKSYGIVGSAISYLKDLVQPDFDIEFIADDYSPSQLVVTNSRIVNNTAFTGVVVVYSFYNLVLVQNANHDVRIIDCTIEDNFAVVAAGILFVEWRGSSLQLGTNVLVRDVIISNNTLQDGTSAISLQDNSRGVVVVDSMNVTFAGNTSFSHNTGTAVTVVSSTIDFRDNITFQNNTGSYGGGLSVVGPSAVIVTENTTMAFIGNRGAIFGGAIFVNLYSNLGSGLDIADCFLYFNSIFAGCNQISGMECRDVAKLGVSISFEENNATSGDMIFGSTLNSCPWSAQYKEKYGEGTDDENLLEIMYRNQNKSLSPLHFDRNPNNTDAVSTRISHMQVERPNQGEELDSSTPFLVAPGLIHHLNVTTYDGFNHLSPSLLTSLSQNSNVTSRVSDNGYLFLSYRNESQLTTLQVYGTPNQTDIDVTLYVVSTQTQMTIKVDITDCPDGYYVQNSSAGDLCVCYDILVNEKFSCTNDGRILVPYSSWIGREEGGELMFGYCSLDYCNAQITVIHVNFSTNLSDMYDEQCNRDYHRSGPGCSSCQEGYSLTFGSNRCAKCNNSFLLLTLLFAVYGILLMVFIVLLHFTIADGYLNGLLFFSNILTIFLPYSIGSEFSTVFVVFFWLSLKVGIQTCFYDGMTALASVALQYAFVLYLYILMLMIVLLSRYSSRFFRSLTCRGFNPTKLFATLFVMTYSSLLETSIDVLSYRTLVEVATGRSSNRWSYDQSVHYFHGAHAALVVFAILLILFFLIPAPLLWMFPSIVSRSKRLQKYKPFYDAVWAPLKPKYRFWVSLRLFLRVIPLVVINFAPIPINLLVLSYFLIILLFAQGVMQPFQKNSQNAVDSLFQAELISLTLFSLYFTTLNLQENGHISSVEDAVRTNQKIAQYEPVQDALIIWTIISTYAIFIGIIMWHLVARFPKLAARIRNALLCRKQPKSPDPTTSEISIEKRPVSYGSTDSDEAEPEQLLLQRSPVTFTELREPLLETSGVASIRQVQTN